MIATPAGGAGPSRRIRVVTTTRAEWHLLEPVVRALVRRGADVPGFDIGVMAGGAHLVSELGDTIEEVRRQAGCPVTEVDFVERGAPLPSDHLGMTLMLGRAVEAFAGRFDAERPDLVVVLGDRFEIMAAALAAVSLRIGLAHIEGGHVTQGAIDERYRHAITKLADLHFPARAPQRGRLLAMGESPERIVASGAIGAALARAAEPMAAAEMTAMTGFDAASRPLLIATFHSETATDTAPEEIVRFIEAMVEGARKRAPAPAFVFTMANLDPGGVVINRGLAALAARRPDDVRLLPSIGARYLSALAASAGVIGNSSSGILEAAAMGVPVLNFGRRQEGRDRYGPVSDCPFEPEQALVALETMLARWPTPRPQPAAGDAAPWDVIASALLRYDPGAADAKPFVFLSNEETTQ